MEWNQLHCFRIVAEKENISAAAQYLHISQPSLSQTVKRLEEEFGYPLFSREGKRIRLNESGRILLRCVLEMEEALDTARLKMDECNGRPHPEVSIYIGCASMLLPQLLQFLRAENPGTQYRIHQWNTNGETKERDICIQPESGAELLLEEEILLALPADHPLLSRERIYLKDLDQEEFISLNRNWALGQKIYLEMNRRKFEPKVTMWVDNPNLMRELLQFHMGIAFVPAVSWSSFAGEKFMMRKIEECHMTRKIYLDYPAGKYLTREQKECIRGIRAFFSKKAHSLPTG